MRFIVPTAEQAVSSSYSAKATDFGTRLGFGEGDGIKVRLGPGRLTPYSEACRVLGRLNDEIMEGSGVMRRFSSSA